MAGSWAAVQNWQSGLKAIHMVNLPTGKVLMWSSGGGVYVWNPQDGLFVQTNTDNSNIFCSGHAGLEDGKVIVAGGHINNREGLNDVNIFDPVTQVSKMGRCSSPVGMSRVLI